MVSSALFRQIIHKILCQTKKEIDNLNYLFRELDLQMMNNPFLAANTVSNIFTLFSLIHKFFHFLDHIIASAKERSSLMQ